MSGVADEHRTRNLAGGEFCRWCRDHGLLDVDTDGTVGPCPMCERGRRADDAQWHGQFWRNRNPADLPNAPVSRAAPRDLNLSEIRQLRERFWPCKSTADPPESTITVVGLFEREESHATPDEDAS